MHLTSVRGPNLHHDLTIWLTGPAQAAEKSLEELKSIRVSEAQFGRGEEH